MNAKQLKKKEFEFKRRSKMRRKEKISAVRKFKRQRSKKLFVLKRSYV